MYILIRFVAGLLYGGTDFRHFLTHINQIDYNFKILFTSSLNFYNNTVLNALNTHIY